MLSLTFKDPKVEQSYVRNSHSKELALMRLSLFGAAFIYGLFAILDYYQMPEDYLVPWLIRFALVCPVLFLAAFSTYLPQHYYRFSQVLLSLCMGLSGFGIVAMIAVAPPPINDTYYAGLLMVVFYGAVAVRLRFINAATTAFLIVVAYELVAIYVNPIPTTSLVANNFFLCMASVMGLMGSYLQELFIRRNWATTQLLMRGRELLAESEAANHAKSEFLAVVSHELRTPLNAIIGFSEFLKMEMFGPLGSDRYKSYAEDIYNSGRHLLEIINDILDLSRAEANKLHLKEEEVSLHQVIDSNMRMFRKTAAMAGVRLGYSPASLPVVLADERLLTQVVTNLISNAIKFSEKGGEVTVSVAASPDGGCRIVVSDTGIGIDAVNIPKVLEPFVQVEGASARSHDGLGLGLPLVKRIAELHDGKIKIESQLGIGTTVSVSLPRERLLRWETPSRAALAAAG